MSAAGRRPAPGAPATIATSLVLVLAAGVAALPASEVVEADERSTETPAVSSAAGPAASPTAGGTENVEPAPPAPTPLFERVRVVGSPEARERVPGSVTYLGSAALERQRHGDVHRVLAQVPGVNIREEEGYGLRPNVGIRGTGAERSSKITLLEDGVLIAPAPYAAPAAYYFPTMGRMEGLEVRKGSASIRQGPYTNGGALNLLSSSIPGKFGGSARLSAGSGEWRGRAKLGSSSSRFGWLVESIRMDTDGFKDLDGGGPTGVDLRDHLVKLRVTSAPEAARFQALELKLGKTDQAAGETYLGLTAEDFRRTPFRRYAASREDHLDSVHRQVQLRYFVRPGPVLDLTATVYRNGFFRNWRKLGKVDAGGGFVGIGDVLEAPEQHAAELAILRGDTDSASDALNVRNNRRRYDSRGVHLIAGLHPGGRRVRHEVELGLRFHRDHEDRFQEEDLFAIHGGSMSLTRAGAPGSQANAIRRAEAWAFHAQDVITAGRLSVTPGFRVESIDFEVLDYGKADPGRSGANLERSAHTVDALIPGVGATYDLGRAGRVFAGIHRGFAPPGPSAGPETSPETSINYELGHRIAGERLATQVTLFLDDYENLLGADTLSAGGTGDGDLFNAGRVRTRGLELSLRREPGRTRRGATAWPVTLAYTFTDARFRSSFRSTFDPWGNVTAGDELPYLPRHQAALGLGMVRPRISLNADLVYRSRARLFAGHGVIPAAASTDETLLVDLAADYSLTPGVKLFLQARNLTDRIYVASRRPAGARPGLPRTILGGLAFEF